MGNLIKKPHLGEKVCRRRKQGNVKISENTL